MPRNTPIRGPDRAGRSAILPLAGTAVLLLAVLLVWRPWSTPPTEAPPRLTVAEAAGLADAALVGRVSLDVQFVLISPREDPVAWRKLPEASRQVFLLAYADEQLRRERLLDLCVRVRNLGNGFTLAELAEAYAAIGLTTVAGALRRAVAIAEAQDAAISASLERRKANGGVDPSPDDPFAQVQGDLRKALGAARLTSPCAAFIRAHAAEILAP